VSSTEAELEIRVAASDDAAAMAGVLVRSRRAGVPAMPEPVHCDESAPDHVRARLRHGEAWIASRQGEVVGFALLEGSWLDMLYVDPGHAGSGVGTALLEVVKHARPEGFALWVFESNAPARHFYGSRGLVELERTDGSRNEERAPDIRMAWPGVDPMRFLRGQIDEVDVDLAEVVNRRVALTREIQRHKDVPGHAGRDKAREIEIAAGMAHRAPVLDVEQWRRIVHEVITVSLDAAEPTE
jgi:GNAT superfamily N-acetyltransferase/chorismate mutase